MASLPYQRGRGCGKLGGVGDRWSLCLSVCLFDCVATYRQLHPAVAQNRQPPSMCNYSVQLHHFQRCSCTLPPLLLYRIARVPECHTLLRLSCSSRGPKCKLLPLLEHQLCILLQHYTSVKRLISFSTPLRLKWNCNHIKS